MAKGADIVIAELYRAWKAGNELSDPGAWKKGQELTNLVGAVVAGVVTLLRWQFPDILIPEGITEHVAEIIGSILVVVNVYLTRATTKKAVEL